jgi:hypothetical protein
MGNSNATTARQPPSGTVHDLSRASFWKPPGSRITFTRSELLEAAESPQAVMTPSQISFVDNFYPKSSSQYEELPGLHSPTNANRELRTTSPAAGAPRPKVAMETRQKHNAFENQPQTAQPFTEDCPTTLAFLPPLPLYISDPHKSCNVTVGVLEGSSWQFNPELPVEPELRSQLETAYPHGSKGYFAFIESLNDIYPSAGLPRTVNESSLRACAKAVKEAVAKANLQMPHGMFWDMAAHTDADSSRTTLLLIFDPSLCADFEGTSACTNASSGMSVGCFTKDAYGEKLHQLEILLTSGVIARSDYNLQKALCLDEWVKSCHTHYVNYCASTEIAGCVI